MALPMQSKKNKSNLPYGLADTILFFYFISTHVEKRWKQHWESNSEQVYYQDRSTKLGQKLKSLSRGEMLKAKLVFFFFILNRVEKDEWCLSSFFFLLCEDLTSLPVSETTGSEKRSLQKFGKSSSRQRPPVEDFLCIPILVRILNFGVVSIPVTLPMVIRTERAHLY